MTDITAALELAREIVALEGEGVAPRITAIARALLALAAERDAMRAVVEAAEAYDSATGGMGWSEGHYNGCGQSSERPCSSCDMRTALDSYRAKVQR